MHRLREAKGPSFEQLPVRSLACLVQEGQGLPGRVNRSSDVLARPLSFDHPAFVEERDITAPIDFAHECGSGLRLTVSGRWRRLGARATSRALAVARSPERVWTGVLPADPGGR